MEIIPAYIVSYDHNRLVIHAEYDNPERFIKRGYGEVRVALGDRRIITNEQRKKIYAMLRDIADWQGDSLDEMKDLLKMRFRSSQIDEMADDMFSLSDCSVTQARDFITYIISFIVEWGVPTRLPVLEYCEDVQQAVYACLIHKKCILCGRDGEMHHVDAIGMGGDRREVYQIGMRVVPLCREHHTIVHSKGVNWLLEDMHVEPVELTAEIGKVYGLNRRNLNGCNK